MRKHFLWTLMFTLLLLATANAQNGAPAKAAALPTADELLDKYVKALGGKEAIEKVTSRVGKGTLELEGMGMSGPAEVYAKAPGKDAIYIELQGAGKVINVCDGEKAYALEPMSGLREKSGAELAQIKRNADFHQSLNLKKHFPKLEVKGKEKVGATDAYLVIATPASGDAEKLYFAADTGLLVRLDADYETPQGKMTIESYFSDYKEVSGVKTAHSIRQVTPMFTILLKLTEVKHNAPVDDAKFAKPAAQ